MSFIAGTVVNTGFYVLALLGAVALGAGAVPWPLAVAAMVPHVGITAAGLYWVVVGALEVDARFVDVDDDDR